MFISTQVLIQQLPFSSPYFVFPFKNKIVTVNYFGEYLSHDFKWESEQYSAIDLISKFQTLDPLSSYYPLLLRSPCCPAIVQAL